MSFLSICPSAFGKLLHHEAAPPLFLVLEKLSVRVFGDSELALRGPVLILGCLSLALFAQAAPRILSSWPATLAVGLFAFSDRLIWHAIEAKPYAVDVLVAVTVIVGYLRTRSLPLRCQCAIWALVLPIAEWFVVSRVFCRWRSATGALASGDSCKLARSIRVFHAWSRCCRLLCRSRAWASKGSARWGDDWLLGQSICRLEPAILRAHLDCWFNNGSLALTR